MKIGMSLFRLFIGCFFIVSIGTSCTKKEASPKITLDFSSSVSAQSGSQIDTIIVNLQSPAGLQVFEYDCEEVSCVTVKFEANAPGNALIQLLVVLEDGSNITRVNYGDILVNLNGGDNFLDIPVNEIGNFVNEAQIFGRYIPSAGHSLANHYLTGELVMKVRPVADRPPMSLIKREIFGGWFFSFATDNIGFEYFFTGHDHNGNFYSDQQVMQDLHGAEGLKMNSTGLAPNSNVRAHYFLADNSLHYEEQNGTYSQRNFETKIVGFFGSNPGNRFLCADSISGSERFDGSNGLSEICQQLPCANSADFYTWADIQRPVTSVDGSSNSCTASAAEIEINLEEIGDHGEEGFVNFFGPFVSNTAAGYEDAVEINSGVLNWRLGHNVYLPAGVEVLLKNSGPQVQRHEVEDRDGGIICEELFNKGFNSIGVFYGQTGSVNFVPYGVGQNSQFAICPKRPGGGYYHMAIFSDGDHGGGPATRIHLAKAESIDGFSGFVNQSVCIPFRLELRNDSNELADSASGPIMIDLNSGGNMNEFYDNFTDCDSNTTANAITFPANIGSIMVDRDKWFYFRTEETSASMTLTATDPGGILSPANFMVNARTRPPAATIEIVSEYYRALEKEAATSEDCVTFRVVAKDAQGELTWFDGSTDIFTMASTHFYDHGSNCSTGTGDPGSPGVLGGQAEWKVDLDTGTTPKTVSGALATCSPICASDNTIEVVDPGDIDHIHAETTSTPTAGQCYSVKVVAYDDHRPNSYPTEFDVAGPIAIQNIIPNSGHIISNGYTPDPNFPCDGAGPVDFLGWSGNASDIPVAATDTYGLFHFKPNEPSGTIDINFNFMGFEANLVKTIDPTPPAEAFISVDEISHDFGEVSGTQTHTFTFTNDGGDTANSLSVTDFTGPAFSINTDMCDTFSWASGNTCTISIDYDGGAAGSSAAGNIRIDYTDNLSGNSRTTYIEFKGSRP